MVISFEKKVLNSEKCPSEVLSVQDDVFMRCILSDQQSITMEILFSNDMKMTKSNKSSQ